MKALVCFKIVPDLDMMTEKDWVIQDNFQIDTSFVKKMINPYDESALETALKLSDASADLCLYAMTIGDSQSDYYLKTLYALQFERAVRVETFADLRFQPEITAAVISKYVKEMVPQDMIFMGKQSGEGDNGKTPFLVAEMLGWPCISEIIRVEPVDGHSVSVTGMTDEGVLTQTVKLPCVFSVGNVAGAYMRVPTLKDRIKHGKKDIDVIDIQKFNVDSLLDLPADSIELKDAEVVSHKRKNVIIQGGSIRQKVKNLYTEYLDDRLKRI